MISLLTPTRDRFNNIKKMIDSITSTAFSQENYEIIFGVDNDDLKTANSINEYLSDKNINFKIVYFERLFYKNFHLYMYELYKHSKGDLLWLFPDDVEILTNHWDIILEEYKNEMYLMVELNDEHKDWEFSLIPIISSKWPNVVGRIADNSQTDLWLGEIARSLKIIKKVKIKCNIFNPADGSQHNMGDFLSKEKRAEQQKDLLKIQLILNENKK